MQNLGLIDLMASIEKIKAAMMFDRIPQAIIGLREVARIAQELERQLTPR